jgi:hypothetical protein
LLLQAARRQTDSQRSFAKCIGHQRDAHTERNQRARQVNSAERAVGLSGGRLRGRNVETRDDRDGWLGCAGEAFTREAKIIGTRVDQIPRRLGAQAALADVFLHHIAHPVQ